MEVVYKKGHFSLRNKGKTRKKSKKKNCLGQIWCTFTSRDDWFSDIFENDKCFGNTWFQKKKKKCFCPIKNIQKIKMYPCYHKNFDDAIKVVKWALSIMHSDANLSSHFNIKNAENFSTEALVVKIVHFANWWSALALWNTKHSDFAWN